VEQEENAEGHGDMTGRPDKITPRDVKVAKTYVEKGGNISAVSRETGLCRASVRKTLDRSDIRRMINDSLAEIGLDPRMVATAIKDAFKAETIHVNKMGVEVKNTDHRTRMEAAKFFLKLQQVDISGKGAGEITGEIHNVSDEDLLMIMKSVGSGTEDENAGTDKE